MITHQRVEAINNKVYSTNVYCTAVVQLYRCTAARVAWRTQSNALQTCTQGAAATATLRPVRHTPS